MLGGVWTSFALVFALAAACGYAVHRLAFGYPRPHRTFRHLRRAEAAFLSAVAEATFPEDGAVPLSGRDADLPGYVEHYFEVLHPGKRFQIHLLLTLFEQATIFFPAPGRLGFRRFSSLSGGQQLAVLQGWAESRFFLRRVVFTALRAVLTLGYLGHPSAARHLRLAPLEFDSPVCEADLLYPPIGESRDRIAYASADLTPPSDGTPLDPEGPIHPAYRESPL